MIHLSRRKEAPQRPPAPLRKLLKPLEAGSRPQRNRLLGPKPIKNHQKAMKNEINHENIGFKHEQNRDLSIKNDNLTMKQLGTNNEKIGVCQHKMIF